MNPETDALCTVVHDCGYQVGRRTKGHVRVASPAFGHPTWAIRHYRLLIPRGYKGKPDHERLEAMITLLGITIDIRYQFCDSPVYVIQIP
jgi:hypothetical protein